MKRNDLLGKIVKMSFRSAWTPGAFNRCAPGEGTIQQEFRITNAVEVDGGTVHLNVLPTTANRAGRGFRNGTTTTLANVELI